MTIRAMEYCARAVVRHLDGDMALFESYIEMAKMIHEKETSIATIEELVSEEIRNKLYKMVS